MRYILERIKDLLGIDEILKEIKKNRNEIPKKTLREFREITKVTRTKVARQILEILENNGGKMNTTKLRNVVKRNHVCSKNTYYNYINKLKARGVLVTEKEGRKRFLRTSSKTLLNISQEV